MLRSSVACLVVGALASVSSASLFTLNNNQYNVEYVAGSGTNKAILAIVFPNQGTKLFGYQWDDSASNAFNLLAGVDSDGGLVTDSTYWPDYFSHTVNGFSYDGETAIFSWPDTLSWFVFTSTTGSDFTESSVGPDDIQLTDGIFIGYSIGEYTVVLGEYVSNAIPPGPINPVPEPATASVLLISAGLMLMRRR